MMTSRSYPSDAQLQYIDDLLEKNDVKPEGGRTIADLKAEARELTRQQASAWIDRLKALPTLAATPQRDTSGGPRTFPWQPANVGIPDSPIYVMMRGEKVVPRGSYAIATDTIPGKHVNETNFYSVWVDLREGELRWSVKQYISDYKERLPRTVQYDVLNSIARDPAAAAAMYGHAFGKCGICGRGLTNDESRARGIGPICAERHGW